MGKKSCQKLKELDFVLLPFVDRNALDFMWVFLAKSERKTLKFSSTKTVDEVSFLNMVTWPITWPIPRLLSAWPDHTRPKHAILLVQRFVSSCMLFYVGRTPYVPLIGFLRCIWAGGPVRTSCWTYWGAVRVEAHLRSSSGIRHCNRLETHYREETFWGSSKSDTRTQNWN